MNPETDSTLLRRFEPIIRFTRGETFFPLDVETYVNSCSLWMQKPGREPVCLIPEGELTLERLAEPRSGATGTIYFLKFIEPLNITELASYTLREGLKKKDPLNTFRPGRGRLARVGYTSRLLDALFSLTLLARGRVPGDTAAAAALLYHKLLQENEKYHYYGRVTRTQGWIALQYFFFYPFNNWRSGFFGINDHEADWEMVYVYCSEDNSGTVTPEWVAYASHDYFGDDLRRRWDDPELEKVGEHPIIYAGAGSHASYFAAGEYLAELELPFLRPVVRLGDYLEELWMRVTRQVREDAGQEDRPSFNIFRIPFVDYARGDGISIGLGQAKTWEEPELITHLPGWVSQYRGLWGFFARDPISGENAPAGPMYNRDGTIRRSWYDPLGWSGLDKVIPSDEAAQRTAARYGEIERQRSEMAIQIRNRNDELARLGVEAAAMEDQAHLVRRYRSHQEKIQAISEELHQLRRAYAEDGVLLEALLHYGERLRRKEKSPLRSHIQRAHHPATDLSVQISRLAEIWSAISIGLMLLSLVGIVLFARHYLIWGLVSMISIIIFVEASFRRQLGNLARTVTIILAIFSAGVLLYEFFWETLLVAVILAGLYIVYENVRELRS